MAALDSFDRQAHIRFFKNNLKLLPEPYCREEVNRLTLAFFCLAGLDILNALQLDEAERRRAIDWVYSLQVLPAHSPPAAIETDDAIGMCGFRGSNWLGMPYDTSAAKTSYPHDEASLAMTYCALLVLLVLGDELDRVNTQAIVDTMRGLQREDGSMLNCHTGGESDLRFVYCACVVSHLLGDWSGMDKEKAVAFVRSCMGYEGAFGQRPGLESHGGTTFCALASLELLGGVDNLLSEDERAALGQWLLLRQKGGFQGRVNKAQDSCYTFWIGGGLKILGMYDAVDKGALEAFVLSCQSELQGGFGRTPEEYADPLHSYFSICGLSLLGMHGLKPIHPVLSIADATYRAHAKAL